MVAMNANPDSARNGNDTNPNSHTARNVHGVSVGQNVPWLGKACNWVW